MSFYLIIFTLIISVTFLNIKLYKDSKILFYSLVFVFFVLFVGFRYEVGGDWYAYLEHYKEISFDDIWFFISSWDPGYVIVEYISKYLGLGIVGVNTLCAIIFFSCFFYFIKVFKIKLSYALLIAYPYLILVVLNGYSRQGVAIGLGMLFISLIYQKKFFKSFLSLFFAVLFHKTAVILSLLYLYVFLHSKNKFIYKLLTLSIVFIFIFFIYKLYILEWMSLIKHYAIEKMQSTGGVIRISINVIAASLLLFFSKRYKKVYDDYNIWMFFGYMSYFMLFTALFFKTTTIADRLCLYFYPLQIVIFPRILALFKAREMKYIFFFALICFYSFVLLVWLLFAQHREAWIPYKNFLFLE